MRRAIVISIISIVFYTVVFVEILYPQDRQVFVNGRYHKIEAYPVDGDTIEVVADRLCLKFKPAVTDTEGILEEFGLKAQSLIRSLDILIVETSIGENLAHVKESLIQTGYFEFVEFDQIAYQLSNPDPYFTNGSQWALHNTGQNGGTNDADIDGKESLMLFKGSSDVVVAILDTGIPLDNNNDLVHPDLSNGDRIILGPDLVNDGNSVKDLNGHGTHVAGIIGAETDNGEGIAGVAGDCKLLIIQIADSIAEFTSQTLIAMGINAALGYQGIKVINISYGFARESETMRSSIALARQQGVLIVASAGNSPRHYPILYPAAHSVDYDNVVCVGATSNQDVRTTYSRAGSEMTIVGPGGEGISTEGIISTTPNYPFYYNSTLGIPQSYGYMSGTSMSAPYVAGVAALIWSLNPSFTHLEVKDILIASVDKVAGMAEANWTPEYGYGRANAARAIIAALKKMLIDGISLSPKATAQQNNSLIYLFYQGYKFSVVESFGQIFFVAENLQPPNDISVDWLSHPMNNDTSMYISDPVLLSSNPSMVVNGDVRICVVWQCRMPEDPSNQLYKIWFCEFTGFTTNYTWKSYTLTPAPIRVSYHQSINNAGYGPTPIIAEVNHQYYNYLTVWAQETGLVFTTRNSAGLWSNVNTIPGAEGFYYDELDTWYCYNWCPSLSTKNNFATATNAYLLYDDRNTVYSQMFTPGAGWSARVTIGSGSADRISSNSFSYNDTHLLAAWSVWDGTKYVIRSRRGYPDNTWSPIVNTHSVSSLNSFYPSWSSHYRDDTGFQNDILGWSAYAQGMYTVRWKNYDYETDYWSAAQTLSSNGWHVKFPKFVDESISSPFATWTELTAPYYQVRSQPLGLTKKVSSLESVNSVKEVVTSRRSIEVFDPSLGVSLRIDIDGLQFETPLSEATTMLSISDGFKFLKGRAESQDSMTIRFLLSALDTLLVRNPGFKNGRSIPFDGAILKAFADKDLVFSKTLNSNRVNECEEYIVKIPSKHSGQLIQFGFELPATQDIDKISMVIEEILGAENSIDKRAILLAVGTTEISIYPNPFNPTSTVRYSVAELSLVRIAIFDILGREIMVLKDGLEAAGIHNLALAPKLASGVYFLKFHSQSVLDFRKSVNRIIKFIFAK